MTPLAATNRLKAFYEKNCPKTQYLKLPSSISRITAVAIAKEYNDQHYYLINLKTGQILYVRPDPKATFNSNVDMVIYYSEENDKFINMLSDSYLFKTRCTKKGSLSDQNLCDRLSDLCIQGNDEEIEKEVKIILKNYTKTTKYFSEDMVSDSSGELSSSDSEECINFTPERVLRPKEVTLQVLQKVDDLDSYATIKGDFLIHACHTKSKEAIGKAVGEYLNFILLDEAHAEITGIEPITRDEYNKIKAIVERGEIPKEYQLGQLIHFRDENNKYCLRQISNNTNNNYELKVLKLRKEYSSEVYRVMNKIDFLKKMNREDGIYRLLTEEKKIGYYQVINGDSNRLKIKSKTNKLINGQVLKYEEINTLFTGYSIPDSKRLENFILSEIYEPDEGPIFNCILIDINKMVKEIAGYEPASILAIRRYLAQGKLPPDLFLGSIVFVYNKYALQCPIYQINYDNQQSIYTLDALEFDNKNQLQIYDNDAFINGDFERSKANVKAIFKNFNPYHYYINHPTDWLVNAGKWSCTQAGSEIAKETVSDYFTRTFTLGNNFEIVVKFGPFSERMYVHSDLTVLGEVVSDYVLSSKKLEKKEDLTYKRIIEVVNHILSKCNMSDKQFSSLQLAIFEFDNQTVSNLFDEINLDVHTRSEVVSFIHFFNALIFGIESSRVNATFVTGVMTLELIQYGKLTYMSAFSNNEYGGLFPMATLKSGSGNLAARRKLIENDEYVGMKLDRQYPQWLAISLKEAKIVKLWMKYVMNHKLNTDPFSRKIGKLEMENLLSDGIKVIFKNYYQIDLDSHI